MTQLLREEVVPYIRAGFSGLWVVSHEADEVQREIFAACQAEKWCHYAWDVVRGLRESNDHAETVSSAHPNPAQMTMPQAPLRWLLTRGSQSGTTVVLLHNFHRFLQSAEIVQFLANVATWGKQNGCFAIVVTPERKIPFELQTLFTVIEHYLPNRAQLKTIFNRLIDKGDDDEMPTQLLDAALGMTRYEAENAFSLSIIRHGDAQPSDIWEQKAQVLKKTGLLSLYKGDDSFAKLGGLESLKKFATSVLTTGRTIAPKGVVILGPPGCGKSAWAKALGNEVGRPTVLLDIGSLLSRYVGDSENNLRQALHCVETMGGCVLFIDEVEKGLAGVGSSGDSGVITRLFGHLLTWRQDTKAHVFVVCTANDVSTLPSPFLRAGRFDAVFFVDLPGRDEKDAIWSIYRRHYDVPAHCAQPADDGWAGAEIESCCRLSSLLGAELKDAAKMVIPISVTAGEDIAALRKWASGRCLSAAAPGQYVWSSEPPGGGRRRVKAG